MNRTGMVMGRVNPILYYEHKNGHLMLAPDTEHANYFWRERRDVNGRTLLDSGYDMKEAGTWPEVQILQRRLQEQEEKVFAQQLRNHDHDREVARKETGQRLYERLINSNTSPYEKEFIRLWLSLRDDAKRDKYREALEHRAMYLWVAEMDSGHDSNITDRIK